MKRQMTQSKVVKQVGETKSKKFLHIILARNSRDWEFPPSSPIQLSASSIYWYRIHLTFPEYYSMSSASFFWTKGSTVRERNQFGNRSRIWRARLEMNAQGPVLNSNRLRLTAHVFGNHSKLQLKFNIVTIPVFELEKVFPLRRTCVFRRNVLFLRFSRFCINPWKINRAANKSTSRLTLSQLHHLHRWSCELVKVVLAWCKGCFLDVFKLGMNKANDAPSSLPSTSL